MAKRGGRGMDGAADRAMRTVREQGCRLTQEPGGRSLELVGLGHSSCQERLREAEGREEQLRRRVRELEEELARARPIVQAVGRPLLP